MTVVNPKSISGINSITMASGSDNLLTIHTTNTTERVRVNSDGDVIVGSGITVSPDGDIFATGVTTSTTFVGALTGNVTGNVTGNISGGTVAGSTGTFSDDVTLTGTNKKIISNSSSSGDYIRLYAAGGTGKWDIYGNGANLRFTDNDSAGLVQIDSDVSITDKIIHTGDTDTAIRFPSADTFSVETGGSQAFRVNSNGEFIMADSSTKTFIDLETTGNNTRAVVSVKGKTSGGGDVQLLLGGYGDTQRGEVFTYTNHDLGFATNNASTQFKCKTNGNFEIVNGNLVVASGHGIDFSATADGPSMGSELFDDYEEGSYTPVLSASGATYTYGASNHYTLRSPHSNADNSSISYVKIGSMVYLNFAIFWNSTITARYAMTLPFTARGSAYALCTTPASFQVDIDGDSLGTLGTGNNSTGFDTFRILKDTSTGGHGNVPLTASSEVYYMISYEAQ